MILPKGHRLQNGKYQLNEAIGQGGFGITYSGVWSTEVSGKLGTVETDIPVCIKEFFFKDYCYRAPDDLSVQAYSEVGKSLFQTFKEKQIKEARILSEVTHPYIVNVLEVFEEHNTAYIAMEFISGCSLKYMLEVEGVLPEKKVLKYVAQIGQALDFVHKKNIVHLDIKPNNILIDKRGNARLIDFGVSKRYDVEQEETCTTMLALSKGFASIEQYDNEGMLNFSPCPDIYSLGATMYNLLTGVIPVESILRVAKPLVKPTELNPEVNIETEAVILRAMQINPADRYQTVREMIDALDIPASYFEETENALNESFGDTTARDLSSSYVNDATEVYTASRTQAHLTSFQPMEKPENSRRRRAVRRFAVISGILIFAVIGYALTHVFYLDRQRSGQLLTDVEADSLAKAADGLPANNATFISSEIGGAHESTTSAPPLETTTHVAQQAVQALNAGREAGRTQPVEHTVAENGRTVKELTAERANESIDAEYRKLIASGSAKMADERFADARKDFAAAKELKITEEVIRLAMQCDEREEMRRAERQRAQYEDIRAFGNYVVVKQKSSRLFGAIDAKGRVRIEVKYINIGRSANGLAFQRQDLLWDIYNDQGVQIGFGLESY